MLPKLGGVLLRVFPLVLGGISFLGKGLKNTKQKDWITYGGVIGIILLLFYFLTKRKTSATIEEVQNMSSKRKRAMRIAQTLGKMYGTSHWIKWWNPMRWFEDEKDAAKLLGKNKDILVEIEQEYLKVSGEKLTDAFERYYKPDQKEYLYKQIGWEV